MQSKQPVGASTLRCERGAHPEAVLTSLLAKNRNRQPAMHALYSRGHPTMRLPFRPPLIMLSMCECKVGSQNKAPGRCAHSPCRDGLGAERDETESKKMIQYAVGMRSAG